jgi:cell fate (sporulation/competence/biofilm development) regulator YlbF (YheA/YmcA/DUF963 family)
MSKNTQQKKQEPVKQTEQISPAAEPDIVRTTSLETAIEQDKRAKTTIQVLRETQERLDALKTELEQPDYNGVIIALMDTSTGKQSTSEEVTLVMSRHKMRWIMANQNNSDCSDALKMAVR